MRYRNPNSVLSPRDGVSDLEVLFDDPDSVSIARFNWFNDEVIGMRWNIALREWDDEAKISEEKECLGMPVSRGYPTWFILPEELFDKESDLSKIISKIKIRK